MEAYSTKTTASGETFYVVEIEIGDDVVVFEFNTKDQAIKFDRMVDDAESISLFK